MIKRTIVQRVSKGIVFARKNRVFYLTPILLLILGDVFLFKVSSDVRIFAVLFFFFYLIKRFTLHSSATFLFSLILFVLTYIQYIFTDPGAFYVPLVPSVERTAVWLYLFLVIGVIQKWRE
ncbi:hypothetical protein HY409_01300 [Candidatus Gottesmanbacteria bacterium]|nr:hypothetical protein [Candidatus Gottesmanbacteria bacterium]